MSDPITDEALMEGLATIDESLQGLVDRIHELLIGVEERLAEEHDCPGDHQVYDSLEQARVRGAECLMWLRSAGAAKLAAASVAAPQVQHRPN